MFESVHIQTICENRARTTHQHEVNKALAAVGGRSIHSIHHAVTAIDLVFSGESMTSFQGTGWLFSTLIVYWKESGDEAGGE